jgi:hypothetical protein
MDPTAKPNVVFQQSVFAVENLRDKWPHLDKVITSRDQLAVAIERAAADPKWQRDPILKRMAPETAKEVLDFYNIVVADGRYVAELQSDARGVAKKLNYQMSDVAFDTMKAVMPSAGQDNMYLVIAGSIVVVGLAATTAVVNYAVDPQKQIVIDESGIVKV